MLRSIFAFLHRVVMLSCVYQAKGFQGVKEGSQVIYEEVSEVIHQEYEQDRCGCKELDSLCLPSVLHLALIRTPVRTRDCGSVQHRAAAVPPLSLRTQAPLHTDDDSFQTVSMLLRCTENRNEWTDKWMVGWDGRAGRAVRRVWLGLMRGGAPARRLAPALSLSLWRRPCLSLAARYQRAFWEAAPQGPPPSGLCLFPSHRILASQPTPP